MPAAAAVYPFLSAAFLLLLLMGVLAIVYRSWRNGISPMPAAALVRQAVVRELKRLERDAAPEGTAAPVAISPIVEAGAGWGTLAWAIAGGNPDWRIIGIENSVIPWLFSRLAWRRGAGLRVRFLRGDLYEFPYETAGTIVCYLYPGAMRRLDSLFRERLASGARVVSVCFALPGWRPMRVVTCGDLYRTKIYIYEKH